MKTRIISAAVAIALLVAVLFVSDEHKYIFNAMVSVLSTLAVLEIFSVTKNMKHKPLVVAGVIWAVLIPFMGVSLLRSYLGVVFFALLVTTLAYMILKHQSIELRDAGLLFMLIALVPVGFSMLVGLRDLGLSGTFGMAKRDGMFLLLTALCCCWLADTGAYFTGRLLGKHKLAPAISPNKTVEGFVGGVVYNVVGMAVLALVYQMPSLSAGAKVNLPFMMIMGLIAAFLGALGDLSASHIKRVFGVKDFGNIMPGHGGVMDRFDSILLVAPFVYCMVRYVGEFWPIIVR